MGAAHGREVGMTDPLENAEARTYTAQGFLASILTRNGKLITYAYDGQGRLTTETWYSGSTTSTSVVDTLTRTYTPEGYLATASNSAGTYTLTYDDAGRVMHVDEPFGVSLSFAYGERGNRILSVLDEIAAQDKARNAAQPPAKEKE